MSDEERDDRNDNGLPREGELLRWAEKTQRAIEFMLQQQAQYQAQAEARQAKSDADMQSLRDLQRQNEERQRQNEERWERTGGEIRALLAIAEIHEREIFELGEAQARNAEAQARTDAKLAGTGERVDALVNTLERLISERRNGGGRGEEKTE
jgi:hypothetical protein